MTDETLISFKELKIKYQLLLAENRLLKAELDAFKAGLSATEIQQLEEHAFPANRKASFNPLRQKHPPKASLTVQKPLKNQIIHVSLQRVRRCRCQKMG